MADRWHYFIGDIHGCLRPLRLLEGMIQDHALQNNVEPFIISVGDLVDRGLDSAAVVRHFRLGAAAGTHAAILGNHEQEMLENLHLAQPGLFEGVGFPDFLTPIRERHREADGMARFLPRDEYALLRRSFWVNQGGSSTLESYGVDPLRPDTWHLDPDDVHFLARLPMIWQSEKFVTTHALATVQTLAVAQQRFLSDEPCTLPLDALRHVCRDLAWRRAMPQEAPDTRLHISGHTPMENPVYDVGRRIIRIDTGCVYGGALTAWCGESNALLSVPHDA